MDHSSSQMGEVKGKSPLLYVSVFNKMVSVDSERCRNNHSIFYLLKIKHLQFVIADHELDVLMAKYIINSRQQLAQQYLTILVMQIVVHFWHFFFLGGELYRFESTRLAGYLLCLLFPTILSYGKVCSKNK